MRMYEIIKDQPQGWWWCRWWFGGKWHGTLIYRTEREAEDAVSAKMTAQGC